MRFSITQVLSVEFTTFWDLREHESIYCEIHLATHLLRNIFRNNIDEELTVVRKKTERDNETYKFVCFLAAFNT